MLEKVIVIAAFIFLFIWGYKSFHAGINNIGKSYWMTSFGTPTSKQTKYRNIIGGGIAVIISLVGIVIYLLK